MPEALCNHCGGTQFVDRIPVGGTGGGVGPIYEYKSWTGTDLHAERLLAQICASCGTVTRFYVDNPKQTWSKA